MFIVAISFKNIFLQLSNLLIGFKFLAVDQFIKRDLVVENLFRGEKKGLDN